MLDSEIGSARHLEDGDVLEEAAELGGPGHREGRPEARRDLETGVHLYLYLYLSISL